ncbi:MAG TPA: sigma-70 family RNA polymerase sigma factor [Myxococcota bacterium]|nr:sigma-70 family RNA polymerase sigma factor [Myxococcota bacterium]
MATAAPESDERVNPLLLGPRRMNDDISTLYRRYIVMVRKRAMFLLGDRALAEDVAQEVFIKFIRFRAKHPLTAAPAGLLYCITNRTAMDRLRSHYRNGALLERLGPEGEEPPSLDDRIALTQAVTFLKEEEAQIAAYYYLSGMDQFEISDTMAIPRRTVSRRLEHFRARMRALLGAPAREEKEEATHA